MPPFARLDRRVGHRGGQVKPARAVAVALRLRQHLAMPMGAMPAGALAPKPDFLTMTRKLALFLCLGTALPGLAVAQSEPSFDCKKASTPVEKAICSDEAASEADRAIGITFQSLTSRADEGLNTALRSDQRDFIAIRDESYAIVRGGPDQLMPNLVDYLELRAEMLNWINTAPPAGYEGNWRNAHGLLTISRDDKGQLTLEGNTVDQVAGSWLCHIEGVLSEGADGQMELATDNGPVRLERKQSFVQLTDAQPNRTQEYCGLNGWMEGPFFYIGAPDDGEEGEGGEG